MGIFIIINLRCSKMFFSAGHVLGAEEHQLLSSWVQMYAVSVKILTAALVFGTLAVAAADDDELCVSPGTCVPPNSKYSAGRIYATPRKQWVDSGGFCGALSIQTLALSYGAYISQDLIRKAAPEGGGHGDEEDGYEISPTNIDAACENLSIVHESFDADTPAPQGAAYLSWMKKELAGMHGIVQFVICQGDEHDVEIDGETYVFDHIEPFFKLFSNHSLDDLTVYDDDVVNHGSDYSPDGEKNLGYFRQFSSLLDDRDMAGNCASAGSKWMQNEMYPCIYYNQTIGTSIQGLVNPGTVDVSVIVPFEEPDLRSGEDPVLFSAELLLGPAGLVAGKAYTIFRYDSTQDYKNNVVSQQYELEYDGEDGGDEPVRFSDPNQFLSSGAIYYRVNEKE